MSDYYELRRAVSQMVPRTTKLVRSVQRSQGVKEKGRKSGYRQFRISDNPGWVKQERLLPTEEIGSFVEVSCRAAACPMPFNADVYDSLRCPYGCKYCFPSGTKILMSDGREKVIERIRPGDRVSSFNVSTLELESAEVVEVYKRTETKLIELELEDGEFLRLTPDHPVFTRSGWVLAKNLTEDDEVLKW